LLSWGPNGHGRSGRAGAVSRIQRIHPPEIDVAIEAHQGRHDEYIVLT
jgi:hypothetical protein